MSGIRAADDCVSTFNAFKLQNSGKGEKYRYILFNIEDEEIRVMKKAPQSESWDDFVMAMKAYGCCYGICDYHTEGDDGRTYDKIIFVCWVPDTAPVKNKMKYASTSESFKGTLGDGLAICIQANDLDELDEDDLKKRIVR